MQTSDTIGELITALAQAQGEFKAVPKSKKNTHLGNMYATLDGVIDTIRDPLAKNGLAFVQPLTNVDGTIWLETRLMHSSGEWMASATQVSTFTQKGINPLQEFGVALSYMRRYMLTSMLGINAEEDTDGNGGTGNGSKPTEGKELAQPHWIEDNATRKRFWAWVKDTKGLTEDEVHTALKVKSVKEYTGTKGEAMTAIDEYIAEQQALEAAHEEGE